MSFFQEITLTFTGMPLLAILALVLGIIFIILEVFVSGFHVFGIIGAILSIAGIVIRALAGNGNPFVQIFVLVFVISIIILTAFLVLVKTGKKGWLERSPIINKKKESEDGEASEVVNYDNLVGKLGVAISDVAPEGKASIDGLSYPVVSEGFFIKQGEGIIVVSVEGGKIAIDRAE